MRNGATDVATRSPLGDARTHMKLSSFVKFVELKILSVNSKQKRPFPASFSLRRTQNTFICIRLDSELHRRHLQIAKSAKAFRKN
jgi:hypothetical protein